jgi:fatty acid desaturase
VNNLESIKQREVVSESNIPYPAFKQGLKPKYGIVWRDITLGYVALALILLGVIVAGLYLPLIWMLLVVPVGAFASGYFLAYLNLFIHEASHHNIHSDRKANDKLANLFLCLPFGMEIQNYRLIHWEHHRLLGTPEDTEHSYFNALSLRFILESLTGIRVLRIMLFRSRQVQRPGAPQVAATRKKGRRMLIAGALFNAALLATAIVAGAWPAAVAWVLAMGVFYPFFGSIRQLLEHRDEYAKADTDFSKTPHGKLSRLFATNLFSRSFGAAGFTRHMLHHWDPTVSYTNLPEVERFLLTTPTCKTIIEESRTTYFTTFLKLMRQ